MPKNTPVEGLEAEPALRAEEEKKRAGEHLTFDPGLNTIIASAELTALYFGVTKQTLANWVKGGCPRHRYGYYDIKAVSEYRVRMAGLAAVPENETDVKKMTVQQKKVFHEQQLTQAKAEAAQLRTAIMRGDYLERQLVVDELKTFSTVLKRSLQGLGKKLSREVAAQMGPAEARRFDVEITGTIDDALSQLAVGGVYRAGR